MQDPGIQRACGKTRLGLSSSTSGMSTLAQRGPSPLPTSPLQDPASHRSVATTAPTLPHVLQTCSCEAEVANTWKYGGKALQTGLESLTIPFLPPGMCCQGAHGGPSSGGGPAGSQQACLPIQTAFLPYLCIPGEPPSPSAGRLRPALSALLPLWSSPRHALVRLQTAAVLQAG